MHSVWSGAISFGLVNIPVRMYTAVKPRGISFHMLHAKDAVRVRQRLVCPLEDREVDRSETIKGYEVAPDQYVTVKDEELDALAPEASRAIAIMNFVDIKQIDPIYYDRPYYLMPDETSVKAYKLLMDAMTEAGKVGLAKFVMRGKEYLAALRPANGVLMLEVMHFSQEVVDAHSLGSLPENVKASEGELRMAQQLIESMSAPFEPDKYQDEYTNRLEQMLQDKAKGKVVTPPAEPHRPARVVNLMEALSASLQQARQAGKEQPPAKEKPAAKRRRKSA